MSERDTPATAYVFVSYASVDRERVLPVVAALRDSGAAVWLDQDDIAGGTIYATEIATGIEGCSALVVLCSRASLDSHNVRQEIALAWKYRRPYLPLLLEPVTVPRELEYWLEGSQWIELFDRPTDNWLPKLSQAIDRLMGDGPPPAPAARRATETLARAQFDVPTPLAPIVGRDGAIDDVVGLIESTRLVTLTGMGGTGKTRLALAVAQAIRDRFDGDIVFVDLAPVHDAKLVISTIGGRLGIQMMGDEPVLATLTSALARRKLLLVVDNLEQVIEAAPEIGTLLEGSPEVRMLATSRAPLLLSGEREYPVAPLALPDPSQSCEPAGLEQNDAGRRRWPANARTRAHRRDEPAGDRARQHPRGTRLLH